MCFAAWVSMSLGVNVPGDLGASVLEKGLGGVLSWALVLGAGGGEASPCPPLPRALRGRIDLSSQRQPHEGLEIAVLQEQLH